MDANIVNYEGRQGRHPVACVCRMHISGYIRRAITEAVTIPMGENYAMRIKQAPQPIPKPAREINLEREVSDYQRQVTDQMDEMDNFKRKIYALEKLLKLYLP